MKLLSACHNTLARYLLPSLACQLLAGDDVKLRHLNADQPIISHKYVWALRWFSIPDQLRIIVTKRLK
nr:hypothetical protein WS71_19900 [Burkholderia mayonis]